MIDRIKKIMESENIGLVKFADEIGVGSSALSHYLGGRNKISLELVTRILERFRGVNPEWLLLGRGEMYKSADTKVANHEPDLFSSVSSPQPVTLMANEDEKTDNSTYDGDFLEPETLKQEEKSEHEPTQCNEPQYVAQTKTLQNDRKSIEKIIVMYSDSTFDCYLPNGKKI